MSCCRLWVSLVQLISVFFVDFLPSIDTKPKVYYRKITVNLFAFETDRADPGQSVYRQQTSAQARFQGVSLAAKGTSSLYICPRHRLQLLQIGGYSRQQARDRALSALVAFLRCLHLKLVLSRAEGKVDTYRRAYLDHQARL